MRVLTSLLDVSGGDLRALAREALTPPPVRAMEGRVVAVLPFGPTAVAPAAFVAAAGRMGAAVIRRDDLEGVDEDPWVQCAEAARHADLLVTSHPDSGFARVVALRTGAAVVNAGEGDGEDPVSGISLIAAILAAAEHADGTVRVAVCGDLADSRSAAAVLAGLASVEADVLLVPARGKEIGDDALKRLARVSGRRPVRFGARSLRTLLDMVDTVLLAHEEAPQLPLFDDVEVPPDQAARRARRGMEQVDALVVAGSAGTPDRLVLHPFQGRGRSAAVPEGVAHRPSPGAVAAALRFALRQDPGAGPAPSSRGVLAAYRAPEGLRCRGQRCVGRRRPQEAAPDFQVVGHDPPLLECRYCGARATAAFAASRQEGRHHRVGSHDARRILPENLVLFRTRVEAEDAGFSPARAR